MILLVDARASLDTLRDGRGLGRGEGEKPDKTKTHLVHGEGIKNVKNVQSWS